MSPTDRKNQQNQASQSGWKSSILLVATLFLGYGPILSVYFWELSQKPGFLIFPIALLTSLGCYLRLWRDYPPNAKIGSPSISYPLLCLSGLLLILGSIRWNASLVFASLLCSAWLYCWNRGGRRLCRGAWAPLGLAALCSPPTVNLIAKWSPDISEVSGSIGSFALRAV